MNYIDLFLKANKKVESIKDTLIRYGFNPILKPLEINSKLIYISLQENNKTYFISYEFAYIKVYENTTNKILKFKTDFELVYHILKGIKK